MILIIDNYDSFVFNIARYVEELGYNVNVVRNDKITLEEIIQLNPSHIMLSPGPCSPNEAGISMEIVRTLGSRFPILGVCLGHQAIGQVFGAKVTRAKRPMHGKMSLISHNASTIFKNLSASLKVGRYHSLIVSEENFPDDLIITARCEIGEIMALQHKSLPIYGVQFHPESVLTESGHALLKNFLKE